MSAVTGKELDILVEDEVARSLLQSSLPASLRSRVTISVIGSATALARQLAALYVRGEERPTLAIFDGDQAVKEQDNLSHAQKMAENVGVDFADWFRSHIAYLPGETWPEAWIVQKGNDCIEVLSDLTSSSPDALSDILEYGLQAGKHHEFVEIAKHLGLDRAACLQFFTISVCQKFPDEFEPIVSRVSEVLTQNG